jgi:uncharacterized protein
MRFFIDTSAFLAILNASDQFHLSAKKTWQEILTSDTTIYSSNYIILETIALLQHRFGLEAVRLFEGDVLPVIEIVWIDKTTHEKGMLALLTANRRDLSLVDCTSFEIIRQSGLEKAFTYDPHFREQRIPVIPG